MRLPLSGILGAGDMCITDGYRDQPTIVCADEECVAMYRGPRLYLVRDAVSDTGDVSLALHDQERSD